jgi:hypothetical protein
MPHLPPIQNKLPNLTTINGSWPLKVQNKQVSLFGMGNHSGCRDGANSFFSIPIPIPIPFENQNAIPIPIPIPSHSIPIPIPIPFHSIPIPFIQFQFLFIQFQFQFLLTYKFIKANL